jgi:adenylosuccinate synthase
LLSEMDELRKRGVDISRLYISDRAHLIMPYHILLDGLEEDALGSKALGTTRKGVGPAFTDKAARLGIRMGDLLDQGGFKRRLEEILEGKNTILTKVYGVKPLSLKAVFDQYCEFAKRLIPYICETTSLLEKAIIDRKIVLLEGAQGVLLDPDFGTYPFTTSSSPMAAGACLGSGISPMRVKHVLAVFKAYSTRVGSGPMPTELKDEIGDAIRSAGHEYGTTTGRPRRCGWFDGVAASFSNRINGFNGMALTRLDVLDQFPKLKICTAYKLDGKTINEFPSTIAELSRCQPVLEEMDGWMTDISGVRQFGRLPTAARRYVRRLEELCGSPAKLVSVGPKREETIIRSPLV